MATLSGIREALRVRLDTIDGLRAYDVMPGSPQYPAAAVSIKSFQYSRDFDGALTIQFYIWLYVNATDLVRAQRSLDAYLAPTGTQSIKAAVEADATLGGTADWVNVSGATEGPRLVDMAGAQPLAIPLDCEVMATP